MNPIQQAFLAQPHIDKPLQTLREAFERGRLTVYLGAGLSLASGLPSWNTLIATLY